MPITIALARRIFRMMVNSPSRNIGNGDRNRIACSGSLHATWIADEKKPIGVVKTPVVRFVLELRDGSLVKSAGG